MGMKTNNARSSGEVSGSAQGVLSHGTPHLGVKISPMSCVGEPKCRHIKSSPVAASEHYILNSILSSTPPVGCSSLPGQAWWVPGWGSALDGALGKGWGLHDL